MYSNRSQNKVCGFKPLKEIFEDKARKGAEQKGIIDHKIISHWDEVVGTDLARICYPERVSHVNWKNKGSMLVLKVPKGYVQIVQMQREQIIESVNNAFGFGAIKGILIEHTTFSDFKSEKASKVKKQPTAAQKKHVREMVKDMENQELQELLFELGLNVMTKNQPEEKK